MADSNFNLPPGFRFFPTDEELIVHFLLRKAALLPCHPDVLPDLDLYPYDPWDLNGKAMAESNKWYFYSRRTQSRITESGYWQCIGMDDPIYSSTDASQKLIGMKKYYAFYIGQPQEGVKTNWMMQEYRLSDSSSSCRSSRKRNLKKDWVACRVYEHGCDKEEDDDGLELSYLDEVFMSMDDLDEISLPNRYKRKRI